MRAGRYGSKIAAQRGLPKPFGDDRKLPDWMATTMLNIMGGDFLPARPHAVVPKGAIQRLW
jgi:5'-3' exonuclease